MSTMMKNAHESPVAIPGLSIPADARALLITDAGDGKFKVKPVEHGKSVLNLNTELLDHLNHYPHSDEWLTSLRDYCDARLAARREAGSSGGLAVPTAAGRWTTIHPNRS